jgi:hypothetical protein
MGLIPQDEYAATNLVGMHIVRLGRYVEEFSAALDLFNLSEFLATRNFVNRQFRMWMNLAARDGAMTIYHFDRVLVKSGRSFKECPTLMGLVDHNAFSAARREFSRTFPKAARVRHGTAHKAEMGETLASVASNGFSGKLDGPWLSGAFGNLTIEDSLMDRMFTTTHQGEILSYEVSTATLDALHHIATLFYSGFNPVVSTPNFHSDALAKNGEDASRNGD